MTAIAYVDWISSAARGPNVPNNGNIGTVESLVTPQLADCFGAQSGSTGTLATGNFDWGEVRPVEIVSLLDVRVQGTPFIDVVGNGPDSGQITAQTGYAGYPTSDFITHLHFVFDTPRMLTGVSIIMNALSAGSRITVGRFWAGPLFVPPQGIQTDWELSIVDPGRIIKTRGGQGWPERRQRARRLSMAFSHVEFAQAFGTLGGDGSDLQALGYAIGNTEPCIVLPRTRNANGSLNTYAMHRLGVYGHAVSPLTIRHRGGDYFDAAVEFEELF